MHFLNIVSIFLSLFVLYKTYNCLILHRSNLTNKEEVIATCIGLLSALNICMDIVMFNTDLPHLLSHFCFGSIFFQSLLSVFMIGYLVQNKNPITIQTKG